MFGWHDFRVLLDNVLSSVAVSIEPFALCLVDKGWRLRLPGPRDAMLHFVLRGTGILRGPGGESFPMKRFSLAVVPPGAEHTLECGTEVQRVRAAKAKSTNGGIPRLIAGSSDAADLQVACGIVHVEYGDSLGLFRHLRDVVVADLSSFPQVGPAFEGILAEQARAAPGGEALTAALMSQCLVYLLRRLSESPDAPLAWLSAAKDPSLASAVDVMFAKPAAAHTVASLADEALMSRSVFAERFQAAFGCTPMTFLRDVRLRQAALLLKRNPSLSIDQIARRVGFSSRSHFSQTFTARFGLVPTAYRSAG